MRIHFSSISIPKKSAKRLQAIYSFFHNNEEYPLSDAQQLTAIMLGYNHWHELEQVTKNTFEGQSDLPDEQCDTMTQMFRLHYQTDVLAEHFTDCPIRPYEITLAARVSARNPLDERLNYTGDYRMTFQVEAGADMCLAPSLIKQAKPFLPGGLSIISDMSWYSDDMSDSSWTYHHDLPENLPGQLTIRARTYPKTVATVLCELVDRFEAFYNMHRVPQTLQIGDKANSLWHQSNPEMDVLETKTYILHEDPAHGWLEVPLEDAKKLGIVDSISVFSYIDKKNNLYLEEDVDAQLFINAYIEKFGDRPNTSTNDSYTEVGAPDCFIRYLDFFKELSEEDKNSGLIFRGTVDEDGNYILD